MSDLSVVLNKIRTAIYGREVRSSIAEGIDSINKEVESNTKEVNEKAQEITDKIVEFSNDEEIRKNNENSRDENFENLKEQLDSIIGKGNISVNDLNVMKKNLQQSIDSMNNNSKLFELENNLNEISQTEVPELTQKINDVAQKQDSDIKWTNDNVAELQNILKNSKITQYGDITEYSLQNGVKIFTGYISNTQNGTNWTSVTLPNGGFSNNIYRIVCQPIMKGYMSTTGSMACMLSDAQSTTIFTVTTDDSMKGFSFIAIGN